MTRVSVYHYTDWPEDLMARARNPVPAYRLHKPTGQAYVRVPDGAGGRKFVYLGAYNSPESKAAYERVLAELRARRTASPGRPATPRGATVNEVLLLVSVRLFTCTVRMEHMSASHAPASAELIAQILSEGPIGVAALARRCGGFRGERPTHPSTLTRWMIQGVKLADGRVVRLEHYRLGNRLISSVPALVRFFAAQQVGEDARDETPRSPGGQYRAANEAGRELERIGA